MYNCSVNVEKVSFNSLSGIDCLWNNRPCGCIGEQRFLHCEAYAELRCEMSVCVCACVCLCVGRSFGVDWWVTGCVWLVRIAEMPSPSPPHPPSSAALTSSVYPSLTPPSLIMASGPSERTTEVNAPRRRGAVVNEVEVKMSGWNRQIKEMRDEADVWWERLKRDWHMREKERGPEDCNLSQLRSFFPSLLPFLLWHFTLDCSLCWSLLTIAAHTKLLFTLTFKCMATEK